MIFPSETRGVLELQEVSLDYCVYLTFHLFERSSPEL